MKQKDESIVFGKKIQIKMLPRTILGTLQLILKTHPAVVALLVVSCMLAFSSKYFLTFDNLMNVTRQASINAILALGMTLIICLGHIDLSVGAAAAFTGVVAASFLKGGMSTPLTILLVAFIGMGIGLTNGVIVTKVRIPFFITTLAMMSVLTGAGFLITGGYPISLLPKSWHMLGRSYLWLIPMPTIIMLCLYIAFQIIQSRSRLGRYIYAVGGNEIAARLCGINVDRIKMIAYMLCGLLASIGGMVLCSRLDSGDPSVGDPFLLSAIAAPILGGTKLSGGEGMVIGTLLGALILGLIDNGLSLMNVNIYYRYVIKGLIILAVVVPQIERRAE